MTTKPFGYFGGGVNWTPTKPKTDRENSRAFYREVLTALDKLPRKRLCRETLYDEDTRTYCAFGAWLRYFRDLDPKKYPYLNYWDFGIPRMQRLVEINDDADMSDRDRWYYVRQWLLRTLAELDEEKTNETDSV